MSPCSPTIDVKHAIAKPTSSTSGSADCGHTGSRLGTDERKRRRKESNRESARRSRQKKQQHLNDLITQVGNLSRENEEIAKKVGHVSGVFETFKAQNEVLKAQKDKLVERLESLESIIEIAKINRGLDDGDDKDNDPIMRPWQLPCPSPIVASCDIKCSKF